MGKTFRGDDRKRSKDSYLNFKDKRKKRSIKDDETPKKNEDKRYTKNYDEEY